MKKQICQDMSRPISITGLNPPQAAAQRFRAAPFAAPESGRLGEADSGRGVRVCVARLQLIPMEPPW